MIINFSRNTFTQQQVNIKVAAFERALCAVRV